MICVFWNKCYHDMGGLENALGACGRQAGRHRRREVRHTTMRETILVYLSVVTMESIAG